MTGPSYPADFVLNGGLELTLSYFLAWYPNIKLADCHIFTKYQILDFETVKLGNVEYLRVRFMG